MSNCAADEQPIATSGKDYSTVIPGFVKVIMVMVLDIFCDVTIEVTYFPPIQSPGFHSTFSLLRQLGGSDLLITSPMS